MTQALEEFPDVQWELAISYQSGQEKVFHNLRNMFMARGRRGGGERRHTCFGETGLWAVRARAYRSVRAV